MRKYRVIVSDPPWKFSDQLKMSDVKRGADAHYETMTLKDIMELPVGQWAADDALLALWVPSSFLTEGLDIVRAYGFKHKQVVTWVKTSSSESGLAFGLGRYFRGCTEHALIGTKGKVSKLVKGKSERNIILHPALPHSQKPEDLQNSLERMLPRGPYLELFARRARPRWDCVGLESPDIQANVMNWTLPQK